jgi:hypothetical protein
MWHGYPISSGFLRFKRNRPSLVILPGGS